MVFKTMGLDEIIQEVTIARKKCLRTDPDVN